MPTLDRTLTLGRDAAMLTIEGNQAVVDRLLADAPFPGGDLALASVTARAETPPLLLGAFTSPAALLRALDVDEETHAFLALDDGRYTVAAGSHDLAGTAQGTVALGALPGTVMARAGAASAGLFAVIQRVPAAQALTMRSAFGRLLASVRLPREVARAEDLAVDTWVMAEVDAGVAADRPYARRRRRAGAGARGEAARRRAGAPHRLRRSAGARLQQRDRRYGVR